MISPIKTAQLNAPDQGSPKAVKKLRRKRCLLETCKRLFTPGKPWQKFCCPEHKQDFHQTLPEVRKMRAQIGTIVEDSLDALMPKIIRRVRLALETDPPPALISRIADEIRSQPGPFMRALREEIQRAVIHALHTTAPPPK